MARRRGVLRRRGRRGAQPLRIEVRGHFVRVGPGVEELLRPVLECSMPEFSHGGPRGWQRHDHQVQLYSIDKRGRLVTHSGLVRRVVNQLHRHGHKVTVVGHTIRTGPTMPISALPGESVLDAASQRFLAAIRRNIRGQIRTRSEDSTAWCLSLLGQLHPKANITIACANRARAKRLQRRLESLRDRQVQLGPSIDWRQGRMIICTADTLAYCTPEDWHIVACTDIQSALAKRSLETLLAMKTQLRYAILPVGEQIGPRSTLLLEALFGTVIFEEPDPLGTLAVVQVLFAEAPGQACRRKKGIQLLDWKRKAIWHNQARNQVIAEIAVALRTGDMKALARRGVRVPGEVDQVSGMVEPFRTAILVESTEHAGQLLRYLPGWFLAHDVPREKASEGPSEDDWAIPVGDKTLVTFLHAERCGIAADAVVRADGGEQWPLGPESFPRLAMFGGDEVLLVDLVDRAAEAHPGQLHSLRDHYAELGWRWALPATGPEVDALAGNTVGRLGK